MKKITKGTIAAGAAVALLLGAGGTLAYWNDTVDVSDTAVITAGNLALSQTSAPAWTITHTDGTATAVADISAVRIVPGDQLTFSADYAIAAQGQNLVFEAGVAPGAIEAASAAPADVALASRLTETAAFTINGVAGSTAEIEHRSNTAGTYAVTIDVDLDWAFGDAASPALDNPAKTGAVDLSEFAVTVTQVDGTP
ncbi:alternate-type signal peptide domain-containing protein [Agrococcus sp. Marseille-P2731]|uniref:alternate-type signal peptide domain-containing protein n=1 Tax=Agrococcus sp. Marseille-P2731 TaxID=1841862 RepID=UPI000931DA49|nr:alternate-type signal peptide domain-containing protein [Agrococcus sp. Marseille-P2731]